MKHIVESLIVVLLIVSCGKGESSDTSKFEMTPIELVAEMGVGWNLGNTLDAIGEDETAWGNPKATQQLIDSIRTKGFKTLRVPVSWKSHIDDDSYFTIDGAWLNRVEEVVNYGLNNDMYVIINIHHDDDWIIPTYDNAEQVKKQLKRVWMQIANRFVNYDENLIFETLNEPRYKGSAEEWSGGTTEGRDCVNQFHQVCVEAIRATGGNNAKRFIMVSPYAASSMTTTINDFILPDSENLIVSIHNYFPYELCLGENGKDWGSDADKLALDGELDRVYNKFIANGTAVVMGEWGNLNHDNPDDRIRHAAYFAQACLQRGICPIWWDNGNPQEFGIINRTTGEWIVPEIANAIVSSKKE